MKVKTDPNSIKIPLRNSLEAFDQLLNFAPIKIRKIENLMRTLKRINPMIHIIYCSNNNAFNPSSIIQLDHLNANHPLNLLRSTAIFRQAKRFVAQKDQSISRYSVYLRCTVTIKINGLSSDLGILHKR